MKKIIITYGLIAGLLVSALMVVSLPFKESLSMTTGMIYGFATMILAFSLIFVAIKQYRDKYLGGSISFGKAFLIGLGITLITSIFYVVTWEIEFKYFVPEFMEEYTRQSLDTMKEKGMTETELTTAKKEMDAYVVRYQDPLYRIPVTFTEIAPVGLLISLVCAGILRRRL